MARSGFIQGIFGIGSKQDGLNQECRVKSRGGKSVEAKVQFSSVAQLCLTLCDPMNHSTPGPPVHHQLLESTQTHVLGSVKPSNHLILCRPLLLLPSIFPNMRVFSSESALRIRWPKYWSFSFYISPTNEHPGLISFRSYLKMFRISYVITWCLVT